MFKTQLSPNLRLQKWYLDTEMPKYIKFHLQENINSSPTPV